MKYCFICFRNGMGKAISKKEADKQRDNFMVAFITEPVEANNEQEAEIKLKEKFIFKKEK